MLIRLAVILIFCHLQPSNQIRLTNVSLVRLKKGTVYDAQILKALSNSMKAKNDLR